MTFEEFEELIENSVNSLPARFREVLSKNGIKLIPRQSVPEPLRKEHPGSVVFGVFVGVPMGRFVNVQTEPTRIELYKESFESVFDDPSEMKRQVVSTVIHEIAHYFGFSEKEIRKLGY
ncbi:MAG: metallopeptidase family protein [Endomicrobiales bacterium]|nr:metallopeptidase family protein [Endomicrobiales bacterium]